MSTSSCNLSHRSWPRPEVVVCNHGIEAEVVTSRTDANPRRRFYRCHIWKEDDCKFFRWIDSSLLPNQDNYMQKLKMERDSMQKALQARVAMQDTLQEKVRSKEVEFESLQIVAENLRRQNRNLKEHFKNSKFPSEAEEYMPVVFSPPRDGRALTDPIPITGCTLESPAPSSAASSKGNQSEPHSDEGLNGHHIGNAIYDYDEDEGGHGGVCNYDETDV